MSELFTIPLSWLSQAILYSMGWSLLDSAILNRVMKYRRVVLVFSHTSYADFYLMILYLLAYPRELKYMRTLVKPQPFEYMGWLLRKLGAIPATKYDEKNGGATPRIVSELKSNDECIFLISPKGTIVRREWHSGYYYIAKELDARLMAAGLDYEEKRVVISGDISTDEDEPVVKEYLYKELGEIVPLFPEDEIMPIRNHSEQKRGVLNLGRVFAVTLSLIIVVCWVW
jgi:1-acyl-sn-glycerol-3-phosphate acyltransferase